MPIRTGMPARLHRGHPGRAGSGTSEGTFTLFETSATRRRRAGLGRHAGAATAGSACTAFPTGGHPASGAGRRLETGGPRPAALGPAMMGWDVLSDWAYEAAPSACTAACRGRCRSAPNAPAWPAMSRHSPRSGPPPATCRSTRDARRGPPCIATAPSPTTPTGSATGARRLLGSHFAGGGARRPYGRVPMLHVGGWYDPMLDGTLPPSRNDGLRELQRPDGRALG